ncbi:MAG: hypothetical protein ACJAWV_003038 [Flammeovirgaceae bacterium]|jgi:hypothetical protein
MFSFSEVSLDRIAIHGIGNPLQEEELKISLNESIIHDEVVEDLLMQYFLSSFKQEAMYHFDHETNVENNEVFSIASKIFDNPNDFYQQSVNMAKLLYQRTNHPNIKTGEMYLAYFQNCKVGEDFCDAIGIFKSETKDTFLKVFQKSDNFQVDYEAGINIKKLDKGCLIFDVEKESGYRVAMVDKTNKGEEAVFWKENFLHLTPREDSYFHTQNYMTMCKGFVDDVFNSEHNVERVEQIEMLKNSAKYFDTSETFAVDTFQEEVMGGHPEVVEAFKEYKEQYVADNQIETYDEFEISKPAVKSNKKIFKSILKLDKNFHVYIHGKREYIEKGFDEERNMNFYKLYFTKEE